MKYYQQIIDRNGTIAVDDTILVKGVPTCAGSHILEGFKPLFSAEVVTRLEKSGYGISGKTCVGEFGLDLVGEFSYGAEQQGRLAGAAATLVKQGEVKAALAVDMNGSPRRSAALADIAFLKPTYGTVSRYGIVSCAASGEQVGVYAQNADGIAEIMNIIAGHDDKDGTSLPTTRYAYSAAEVVQGKRVALVRNLFEVTDEQTKQRAKRLTDTLKASGVSISEISIDTLVQSNIAWQILMSAETCNNVSRYDGVKFGYRADSYKNIDELYINSRTEGFNFLTKSVILYGSDVLSKSRYNECYEKALKIRRIIAETLCSLFEQFDALLMPTCSSVSYEDYDIKEAFGKVFKEGLYTSAANLVGVPALVDNGLQLLGNHYSESLLLSIMKNAEERSDAK